MTQYVEKFPVPDPKTPLARKIVATIKHIYETTPSEEADRMASDLEQDVRVVFGLE